MRKLTSKWFRIFSLFIISSLIAGCAASVSHAEEYYEEDYAGYDEGYDEYAGDYGYYDDGAYDENADGYGYYEEEEYYAGEDDWALEDDYGYYDDAGFDEGYDNYDGAYEEVYEEYPQETAQEEAITQTETKEAQTQTPEVYEDRNRGWPKAPEIEGEAVILMEANTHAVIYEKNAAETMYPASTTKILTALVVLDHCSLDETVVFTDECCDLEEGAVTIDSVPGEEMSLKDVMYGLLLPSGNDCAMALALHVSGDVDSFATLMNQKAREIGAMDSHFVNPSGLFHPNHYTTASDLALIAQYAFRNSTFVDIISHPTYIIEPTNMNQESRVLTNTHEMIIPGSADYCSDVIGGKTGYLYESGRCLVTYAERNGVTLLAVIMDGSYYGIFGETQELLDFGWDNFTILNVSETERRFSYADESAKVQIDPSNQILALNGVPFNDLTAKVNYAYNLNDLEYEAAKEAAGITQGDPRQLYASIDYSFDGHYLGSCNIFINPNLPVSEAEFIHVVYINFWLLLAIVVVVALIVIMLLRIARRRTNTTKLNLRKTRRSERGKTRYYNRSDSIDLRNQYIKNGGYNRQSIRQLDNIGVNTQAENEARVTGRAPGRTRSQAARGRTPAGSRQRESHSRQANQGGRRREE